MARRPAGQLRRDALAIWQAALDAVDAERLVASALRLEGNRLRVDDEAIDLSGVRRIVVVGAGKAGAGMAAAIEGVLGPRLLADKDVTGWVNVPAGSVRKLQRIHLHPGRPDERNEPTEAGVAGAEEILRLVGSLTPDDLCLVLVSGGASALLPAPVEGIALRDKLAVTRHLSAAGANIGELNTVRKALSRIKGGKLAQACRAGQVIALIISDVLGDPLDLIGSGPTVESTSTPADALRVLERFDARGAGISKAVFEYLQREAARSDRPRPHGGGRAVKNVIIGNNALAVDAAGVEAERRGYSHAMISDRESPTAEDVGRHLADMALRMRSERGPDCLISGGEPVVSLAPEGERGLGGRNQQLVLAALERLLATDAEGVAILSGGTDGEDGPTDAAGAIVDDTVLAEVRRRRWQPAEYLRRNDAYRFFEPLGALIKTGPTGTNVCDIRVVLVDRVESLRE